MFEFLFRKSAKKAKKEARQIANQFDEKYQNLDFDVKDLDEKIEHLSDYIYQNNKRKLKTSEKTSDSHIGVLATMLYDTGGHTPCILSLLKSLFETKTSKIFLSENEKTVINAPQRLAEISKYTEIYGLDYKRKHFSNQLIKLYNEIITFSPSCLFVFIHPDDVLMTAVLALVKKHTNIKVIYFNHASHFPNLGMNFADLVLEGMPITQYVTENYRHIHKCNIFGLQSKAKEETIYHSPEDIAKKRQELGIPPNTFLTISGASAYKFFDKEKSPHFELIRDLLQAEPNLHHIVVSDLSDDQKKIVDDIFLSDPLAKNRLHFALPITDFDLLFQCADIFIDSFPVSSALTQIDLMRNKVPTIVKINAENSLYSFHEYLPPNYTYMFETVDGMKDGVRDLLNNPSKREKIKQELYQYYLNVYEEKIGKEKYLKIIECKDNLECLYTKTGENKKYKIKGIK